MTQLQISPEDRARAQEARKEKREAGIAYANKHLRVVWDEDSYWKEQCSVLGIRRFQWYEPANAKNIRKALKKVGKDSVWFSEVFGYSKYEDHARANPSMTANALLGFLVEELIQEKAQ